MLRMDAEEGALGEVPVVAACADPVGANGPRLEAAKDVQGQRIGGGEIPAMAVALRAASAFAGWRHLEGGAGQPRTASTTPPSVRLSATISRAPNGSPKASAATQTPITGASSVPIEAVEAGRRRSAANQPA